MNNEQIKVVIADDDATTRLVLRLLLTEHGFDVVGEAANGEAAIELCEKARPNLAFLDIDMPKLDGNQAARKIRQLHPDIAIIIVSAVSTLDNVRTAMQSGAGAFVVKPFSAAKLIDAINACTKNSQRSLNG